MISSPQSAPIYSIASTSSPAMVSVCANASGGIVMSTYSFSQLSGTFIFLSPHHLVKNAGLLCQGEIMSFNKIIRTMEHPARADQSAVGAINRPLLYNRIILLKAIITTIVNWLEL